MVIFLVGEFGIIFEDTMKKSNQLSFSKSKIPPHCFAKCS
jgi:hypothetical protein